MTSRRDVLQGLQHRATTHPGLWLDRYLQPRVSPSELQPIPIGSEASDKSALIHEVAAHSSVPEGYPEALNLLEYEMFRLGAVRYVFRATGRLAIWLKSGNVLETGVALHHTWGTPMIPARSIKGVASAACEDAEEREWNSPGLRSLVATGDNTVGRDYDLLFGTQARRGAVIFFDAWWQPQRNGPGIGIADDVMTPHYNSYYQKGDMPTGMEDPVPVPFAAATGAFVGWLLGSDAWTQRALELISHAMTDRGIGAKSAAGYGYGSVVKQPLKEKQVKTLAAAHDTKVSAPAESTADAYDVLRAELGTEVTALTVDNSAFMVPLLLPRGATFEERRVIAEMIVAKLGGGARARNLAHAVVRELEKALRRKL